MNEAQCELSNIPTSDTYQCTCTIKRRVRIMCTKDKYV